MLKPVLTLAPLPPFPPTKIVPAVYRFLGVSFAATPTQLGYITLSRALVQALSSPLGGIAGGWHPPLELAGLASAASWRPRKAALQPQPAAALAMLPADSLQLLPMARLLQGTACTAGVSWVPAASCGPPAPRPLPPAARWRRGWRCGVPTAWGWPWCCPTRRRDRGGGGGGGGRAAGPQPRCAP